LISKEEGGTALHTILTDKGEIPLNVPRAEKTNRICAKCGRVYIWAGLIKRSSKYGEYHYIQITHYLKQNKKKKRKTCYLNVLK